MEQNQQATLGVIAALGQEMKAGFRVLNNNIRCFGGWIEGGLIRQVNSNQGQRLLRMNQAAAVAEVEVETNTTLSALPWGLLV
jgi:hypothetical protein